MNKDIFIILPYKESLLPKQAGAVSIYVKDTVKYSKYKKKIQIISSDNIDKSKIFRNRNYILNFCKKYKNKKINLIEIHNRPEYVTYISKNFPNTKVNLIFHNDPLSLRGSINSKERENILFKCNKIIFISRWIQQRFFSTLKNINVTNTEIVHHGIIKSKKISFNKKQKNILFVGKLNRAKGYHIFCDVAKKFKKIDPSWNFIAIGNEARKNIFPDKKIVKEIGYKKNSEVLQYYSKSEISIGNSVWNEPLGRIAIESSSRKCMPLISNKGGLEESKHIAIVLKNNTSSEIINILKKYTSNKKFLRIKQNLFYKNNDFDLKLISKKLDVIREDALSNINTLNEIKNIKILHIANFNENADGRLFYSFSNKINNGLIKNNYTVQTISDRLFLKNNRSLFQPFNPIEKFNDKILNTLKNFSPNLIILGHVFSVNEKVINYCKKNNIKIISWYIDSISPEFLKKETKKNFFKNLSFVDKCFITSSPNIFKKNNFYNKIKFIPNPVDSSMDCYHNYSDKYLEYDVFVAISHGQNRGILKRGKSDERENLINDLISELPQSKFAKFGVSNFEPIWGSNYYHYLSKAKMGLNISRGSYQNLYSSDRISSLIGNGLLVFINHKTNFHKIFSSKEVVYYKNKKDLISKIKYYSKNDNLRSKIAKAGYLKYHKYMNNKVISKYMLSSVGLVSSDKIFWQRV